MPFSRALERNERRAALSRNWTLVIESISNEDNRYTNPNLLLPVQQEELRIVKVEIHYPKILCLTLKRVY